MARKEQTKRTWDRRLNAYRQSSSLSSSETQQPASKSGPEHTPSPDTVPSVQSATISSPKKQSDGHDVEIFDGETSDVEIVMQESPSLASIGTSTLMFRHLSTQAFRDAFQEESPSQASTDAPTLIFRHLSIRAFRETFQQGTNGKKRAETNNNNTPGKSSRVVVWKQPKEKVCSVCAEMLPWQHFPRFADCEHDPDVCDECFLLWLKQQMESVTDVLCPSSGCSRTITHEDVRKNTPQDVFTRFDELSMRSLLSADKNFLYCHAEGCSSGQIHDTGMESPIFRCVACGYRMCTAHHPIIPFHENETCTQYNERIARETAQAEEDEERHKSQQVEEARVRREQEAASAAEVAKSSVECPGCGVQIQKTEGCDHMTCRRNDCRFEFCYVCRAPYDGMQGIHRIGNAAHNESCPYHPKKLPTYQGTA